MAKGTTFNVTRVVTKGEKKFFNQVGKIVLHESGKTGVLFLHMFDGEYALFLADKKKDDAGEDGQE